MTTCIHDALWEVGWWSDSPLRRMHHTLDGTSQLRGPSRRARGAIRFHCISLSTRASSAIAPERSSARVQDALASGRHPRFHGEFHCYFASSINKYEYRKLTKIQITVSTKKFAIHYMRSRNDVKFLLVWLVPHSPWCLGIRWRLWHAVGAGARASPMCAAPALPEAAWAPSQPRELRPARQRTRPKSPRGTHRCQSPGVYHPTSVEPRGNLLPFRYRADQSIHDVLHRYRVDLSIRELSPLFHANRISCWRTTFCEQRSS